MDSPSPRVPGQARPGDASQEPRATEEVSITAVKAPIKPTVEPTLTAAMPTPRTFLMPRRIIDSTPPASTSAKAESLPSPRKMIATPVSVSDQPVRSDVPPMIRYLIPQDIKQPASLPVPRQMRGQIRRGLKISERDVMARFPLQPEQVAAQVVKVLSCILIDDLDWTQAQTLGVDLQREYGQLVQKLLDASSSDVMRTGPQHLSRLLTILQTCADDFNPTSLLGGWLRKDKTPAVDLYRQEIEHLRSKLNVSMSDLDVPVRQIMGVRGKLKHLSEVLTAVSLACEWLADHPSVSEEVRSVLADRMISLTKTVGLVHQQQAQSLATANQLDALRDRIQDAVLITLPTWLATLASQVDELNETQRFVVRDDLRQIIHRLKN